MTTLQVSTAFLRFFLRGSKCSTPSFPGRSSKTRGHQPTMGIGESGEGPGGDLVGEPREKRPVSAVDRL